MCLTTFILQNQELRFVTDSQGFLGRCEADWVEQILTLINLILVAEILCRIEMGTHDRKLMKSVSRSLTNVCYSPIELHRSILYFFLPIQWEYYFLFKFYASQSPHPPGTC